MRLPRYSINPSLCATTPGSPWNLPLPIYNLLLMDSLSKLILKKMPTCVNSFSPLCLIPSPSLSPRPTSSTPTQSPNPARRKPSRLLCKSLPRMASPWPTFPESLSLVAATSFREPILCPPSNNAISVVGLAMSNPVARTLPYVPSAPALIPKQINIAPTQPAPKVEILK